MLLQQAAAATPKKGAAAAAIITNSRAKSAHSGNIFKQCRLATLEQAFATPHKNLELVSFCASAALFHK